MALGDGIRRNIASVDPAERALLRAALLELNRRFFPGNRTDPIRGGVSCGSNKMRSTKLHTFTMDQNSYRGIENSSIEWRRCLGKSILNFPCTIGIGRKIQDPFRMRIWAEAPGL